ncbi:CatA-like O-acetyltransferase [Providencia hangzhouensis]
MGFSLTTKIDITNLKRYIDSNGYEFYPSVIYLLSRVVNTYKEFRFCKKKNDELILWMKCTLVLLSSTKYQTFSLW